MPAFPIAHAGLRACRSLGCRGARGWDERTPAGSTVARAARSSTRVREVRGRRHVRRSGREASARTPAVPQQRPLLSQKPGRRRRGSPEVGDRVPAPVAERCQAASPVIRREAEPWASPRARCTIPSCIARSLRAGAAGRSGGRGSPAGPASLRLTTSAAPASASIDEVAPVGGVTDRGQGVRRSPGSRARCGATSRGGGPHGPVDSARGVGSAVLKYGVDRRRRRGRRSPASALLARSRRCRRGSSNMSFDRWPSKPVPGCGFSAWSGGFVSTGGAGNANATPGEAEVEGRVLHPFHT